MAKEEAYVSPLMSRIASEETLNLKNLALYVPKVQKATEVEKDTENTGKLTSIEISTIIREGEKAKEKLIIIALPLIKKIAYKEHNRRKAWQSRVSLEDMVQEGVGGFLRGIQAYNVDAGHTSATNYLGQWILSDMRRNIEILEHDFTIPQETIERHRKIRAIRGRLSNELGRNPTDQEIIDSAASNDSIIDNKMGRVKKDPNAPRKLLTQKHLNEERSFYSSTGQISPITISSHDGESDYEVDASPLLEASTSESIENVDERDIASHLRMFLKDTISEMNLGTMQTDLIARKFGLSPYKTEQTAKEISDETKITKYKVGHIISLFSAEMTKTNGIFHKNIASVPYAELESMNLQWIIPIVGEYTAKKPIQVDPILRGTLRPVPTRRSFGKAGRTARGYVAEFFCERHQLSFTDNYLSEYSAPEEHACPQCGDMAKRA